ncbi:MAG: hypothetical protein WC211_01425 [Dehalococcoidia bacterium]
MTTNHATEITEAEYERLRMYEGGHVTLLGDGVTARDMRLASMFLLRRDDHGNGARITNRGRAALERFRADHGIAGPEGE